MNALLRELVMKSSSSLNLIHLANFNSTNIGNGALIKGLESSIEEDFPCAVQWQREPWDNYTFGVVDFDEAFVDKINASHGLIIGGAVTFNGRDYNHRTGTRFELPFELWSKITKPVVFYGLSYRHWPSQVYHHLDKLKLFIEKILASENMILAVRNDGTKDWLKGMTGISSEAIIEIPDSAVYVTAQDGGEYPEILPDVKNIMVSFNDEDMAHRFDTSYSVAGVSNRSRDYVIDEFAIAIEKLAENFSANFILCPHYFDDYRFISNFLERINPRIAHQRMVSTGLGRVKDSEHFYGRYRSADVALSMRVHSMSPCIGLGTPMVAYTTQNRMTDFMRRIDLKAMAVDAFAPSSGMALFECAKYALENAPVIRKRFLKVRAAMREDTRAFHHKIYELLTA
jgi:polysaccharide pyruvyl transferase WcaK-like protein